MKILFTGDSITGWSDLSRWIKYSHIVECMIDARSGPGAVQVVNRGIGGNTTADLLGRLEEDVLAARPDLVVMLIGGNDGGKECPREATVTNLDTILKRVKDVCPRVLLLEYHMLPRPDCPEKTWWHLDTNNDLIAAAATAHECPLLSMAAPMRDAVNDSVSPVESDYRKFTTWQGDPGYRTSDLVAVDGVHLTFGGELVFARAVFEKLLSLGWLPAARAD